MSNIRSLRKKLPLAGPIMLILAGIYIFLKEYFAINPIYTLLLLAVATASMYFVIDAWEWFSNKYAPKLIYWTTTHKWIRKVVAGGSFTYYEFKGDKEAIKKFEPISRFMSLMIAFLGFTSTFAKLLNFFPENPVGDEKSLFVWIIYLIVIPFILTPIIPIIWTMEDLGLKAWNKKTLENWRIAPKYKKRFNSFIAIGTLSIGLGLTNSETLGPLENALAFAQILLNGVIVLIYPVAVLTLLYYLRFRGTVNTEVRAVMDIVTGKTKLHIVDAITGEEVIELDSEGKIVKKKILKKSEEKLIKELNEDGQEDEPEEEEDQVQEKLKFHQKIGKGTKNTFSNINKKTFGRISKSSRIRKAKREKLEKKEKQTTKNKYTGGSATRGLWGDEEKKDE